MLSALLIGILASQVVVPVCFCLVLKRWYDHQAAQLRDDLLDGLRDFVTAPDKNTPSPLAVITDQMATLLAARLMQDLKAMLAGVESGNAKGEQLALIESASDANPWLALLSNILPKRIRNGLLKNPQMIGALSKLGHGSNGGTPAVVTRKHHE